MSNSDERIPRNLDFVEKEIKKQINSFDKKRKFYRQQAERFMIMSAGLSALTTVLIGVGQILSWTWISIGSLITSATVSFVSAWEGFYNYRQRWIQNTDTLVKLYALDSDIQYKKACSGNNLTDEEIHDFYKRLQNILQAANEKWLDDRSQILSN